MATLEVDEEEYPVPSDGDVTEDFEEYINELFHDIDEGKLDKTGTFYTALKAVKDANPKS